jgi:hypothetical protein
MKLGFEYRQKREIGKMLWYGVIRIQFCVDNFENKFTTPLKG